MKKISYQEIEVAIARYYGTRRHIIVPNCYISFGTINDHECDLLIIRPSGYAIEIEIKMTKHDMKADLKKKHGHENKKLKELYYAMPKELYEECKNFVPDHAGVYLISRYDDRVIVYLVKDALPKKSRKLLQREILNMARLGTIKLWNIKEKLL